ncbi:MAG: mechanosensitive ion channel [Acidimicrobiia bacterium]|nr:mechanosensitive ion channel [Acidimicrobiia bacterium]
MDVISDYLGISESTQLKILASLVTVILLLVGRSLVLRSVRSRFEEAWVGYRARKVATYVVTVVGLSAMAFIWIDAFNDLPTFLGLLSAGIAIALSDVLKNMAGWIYILSRRPFRVGDRIEIGGTKGDVVDIRLFRFSLMEVGNWIDAEQSTGRLVHVPNGLLFGEQVANYTEGFEYIWQEIPVLVTFESSREEARRIVTGAVNAHAPDIEHIAGKNIRQTAEVYHIKFGSLTPIVYLSVEDSGVLFTARYLVPARRLRDIAAAIWEAVLDGIDQTPNVELAYPTVRTFLSGPVALRHDDSPSPETG